MNILHVKGSDLAWAPDAIAEATNKWTEHMAYVWPVYHDEKSDLRIDFNRNSVGGVLPMALRHWDIIHFHNKPRLKTDLPSLMLYHSEPGPRVDLTYQGPKYVIAQYQMTLPEYDDCKPMRNVINFVDNPLFDPLDVTDKIRVAYSPSILTAENKWYDKGAEQTIPILERLKAEYPDRFDFDLIRGVSPEECLRRKRLCNVVIDECVTGSYHRSGLEGLAMGKMTITGNLLPRVYRYLRSFGWLMPFEECDFAELEDMLSGMGRAEPPWPSNRAWMERHWHPRDIALEWIAEYEKVLNGQN